MHLDSSPLSIGEARVSYLQLLSGGFAPQLADYDKILPQLTLFCALSTYLLPTGKLTLSLASFLCEPFNQVDDVEFYEVSQEERNTKFSSMPFTLAELRSMTLTLRDVCIGLIQLAYQDKAIAREDYSEALKSVRDENKSDVESSVNVWKKLFKCSVSLVRLLFNRDSSRPFCAPGHWISKQVMVPVEKPTSFRVGVRHRQRYQPFRGPRRLTREELEDNGPPPSLSDVRTVTILQGTQCI